MVVDQLPMESILGIGWGNNNEIIIYTGIEKK